MTDLSEPKPMFAEPLKSHIELSRSVAVLMALWALLLSGWRFVPPFFPAWLKLAALGSLTAFLVWLSFGVLLAAHKPFYAWLGERWQQQTVPSVLLAAGGFICFWSATLGVIMIVVGAISLGIAL